MQRVLRFVTFGVALTALVVTSFLPSLVSAHEQRDVADGKYHFVVGFLDEPAYSGFKNISIFVSPIPLCRRLPLAKRRPMGLRDWNRPSRSRSSRRKY